MKENSFLDDLFRIKNIFLKITIQKFQSSPYKIPNLNIPYFKINAFLLLIIPLLLASCTSTKQNGFESIQTPKERFFTSIMDIGNLIGEDEKILLNIIEDFKLSDSPRKQNTDIDPDRVKVIRVKLKNETEYFWFVDGSLTEIHIPVGTKGIFEIFSSNSISDEIIKIMGKPHFEYGSKSYPTIRNLMYNSNRFSLHFTLSNINLDKGKSISDSKKMSKSITEPHLEEIRLTPPNRKPTFIGVLEKEIYSSGSDLYGFDEK